MKGHVILEDIGLVVSLEEYNQKLIATATNSIKGKDLAYWVSGLLKDAMTKMDEAYREEMRSDDSTGSN